MTKEELENQKLQSEIDKNKAEEEKARLENQKLQSEIDKNNAEDAESKKRTKFRWDYIIAGVIGAAAIYSWVHSTFSDLAKERNELANVRHERLQIRSDSLLAASNVLASQKDELNKQVIAITARLDSTVKQQEKELGLVTARLKEEESKEQSNREEIKWLTAQVSRLKEDIKNTKSETEQIRTIVSALLSADDVTLMIKTNNYYDRSRNPMGLGVDNKFELQPGDSVVYDAETHLAWQRSGSPEPMLYEETKKYIAQLNASRFAGYDDWQLPTLEEAMSLMEAFKQPDSNRFIDPVFDAKQDWLLTSDSYSASAGWGVTFTSGSSYNYDVTVHKAYVRAVR